MNKKIAIHHRPGSFSDQWIKYCEKQNIPFSVVNCYDNNIIENLKDCNALMWHFHHNHSKDILFARQLLYALEQSGIKTFPNFNTMWHFDDKVGQKYLLEAIKVPFINTYVFYDKKEAQEWVKNITFPKVFKLRSGSGSSNVLLVNTKREAKKIINKAFSKGFRQRNNYSDLKERYRKFKIGKASFTDLLGGVGRILFPQQYIKTKGTESGYVYFQDFIPGNSYDIRIIVIDEKAFAIKRMVRENDFRASGSGNILYDRSNFEEKDIALAFEIAKKMNIQSMALDLVFDKGISKVVEISYGFSPKAYENCVGYWDSDLNFYEESFDPFSWMVEGLLKKHENEI